MKEPPTPRNEIFANYFAIFVPTAVFRAVGPEKALWPPRPQNCDFAITLKNRPDRYVFFRFVTPRALERPPGRPGLKTVILQILFKGISTGQIVMIFSDLSPLGPWKGPLAARASKL